MSSKVYKDLKCICTLKNSMTEIMENIGLEN